MTRYLCGHDSRTVIGGVFHLYFIHTERERMLIAVAWDEQFERLENTDNTPERGKE